MSRLTKIRGLGAFDVGGAPLATYIVMRRVALGVLGSLVALAIGCAGSAANDGVAADDPSFTEQGPMLTKLPANMILVPLIRQKVDYSCGDVSTLSVLQYWKYADYKSKKESDLFAPLKTSKNDGTDPAPIR